MEVPAASEKAPIEPARTEPIETARRAPYRMWQLAALCALVALSASASAWWLGPWSAPYRYQRMDMVSLRQMLDASPDDALGWRVLGLRLAREGDGAMAEPALLRAYQLDSSNADVATGLGEIMLATNRLPEAFQILKAVVAHSPRSVAAHRALGRLYKHKGSYQHAVDEFEAAVRLDPQDAELHYNLAGCYLQMQQPAKAQSAIDASLRLQPDDPRSLALKGSIEAVVGNLDAGIAATRKAAELAPENLQIQSNYANMLLAHHRNAEDLNQAEQAIGTVEQINPNYPLLPYQHGLLEGLHGHWPQAVQYLERARQSAPGQDEVYYALSQAYRRVQRPVDADAVQAVYVRRQTLHRQIQETRITLGGQPDNAALYGRLADLQLAVGDTEDARSSLEAGLEISPHLASLQTRLAQLQRAAPRRERP